MVLTNQPDKEKAQCREIGDNDKGCAKEQEEGESCTVELNDRPVEPVAGQEEVEPDRWGAVANLEVSQEDYAKMNQVDVVGYGNRHYKRDHQDQGGKDIQHCPYKQQEYVEEQEEGILAGNILPDEFKEVHGNFLVNQKVSRGHGRGQDYHDTAKKHHGLNHDARQLPELDIPV